MLFRYSLNLPREAGEIEGAVDDALSADCRTRDIVRDGECTLSTTQMTEEILAKVAN